MRLARIIPLLTLIGWCASTGALAAEVKLGFVDAERVFMESKVGKQALGQLKTLEDSKKTELKALETRLDEMERELALQGSVLSESSKKDREEEIRQTKIEFKRTAEDAERELRRMEKAFLERIDREVMVIIEKVGKAEGYTMIVGNANGNVLYISPAVDITDRVIAAYDQESASSP